MSSGAAADGPQVVTLDERAQPSGSMPKLDAHRGDGHRHLAFSVVLRDEQDRVLLQRRASTKHHFAGDWANTCCSHPEPGERVRDAAARRLGEELGLHAPPRLEPWAAFSYEARDERSGLIEVEYDVVVTGRVDAEVALDPDPAEVAEVAWFDTGELTRLLLDPTRRVAPWLPLVLETLREGPSTIAPRIPL